MFINFPLVPLEHKKTVATDVDHNKRSQGNTGRHKFLSFCFRRGKWRITEKKFLLKAKHCLGFEIFI